VVYFCHWLNVKKLFAQQHTTHYLVTTSDVLVTETKNSGIIICFTKLKPRMWANGQRDGRPAEHR